MHLNPHQRMSSLPRSSTNWVNSLQPHRNRLLLGMINHLNGLGLALVSVECLPTPVENEPSGQDDA
jgi:hypothetical protein